MSFRTCIVFCVAILCLLSCTSKPTRQGESTSVKVTEVTELPKDSLYYLNQAKQNYDVYQRNDYLIQAAEALQTEQKCNKSIRMLRVLKPELQDNRHDTHANIILAECYLILSDKAFDVVASILVNLPNAYGYQARIASLETQLHVNNKQWLQAAKTLQATGLEEIEKSQTTWKWINKLALIELEKAQLSEAELQPWLQLAIIVKRFALEPESYKQQLIDWQSGNFGHPLVTSLPAEIEMSLLQSPIRAKRVAILLPLSGRLANQGIAIKEGILAAYLENLQNAELSQNSLSGNGESPDNTTHSDTQQYREIRFFDSALKTTQQINSLVADFDVILGPLLKQKIIELTAVLPKDKILLALNRVELEAETEVELRAELNTTMPNIGVLSKVTESNSTLPEHYYFSLAPEDEAQQLALHIQQKQLIRPIVFAADNPTTQRMAQAFITTWQKTPNAIQPDLTIFTDNKDMRIRVSEMLDVAQSKQRIRQMEVLSDVEVFGVERNRRDIDAIVLFANPEQTQLLNPIIEASLSPFARKSLAVFASSRSYSLDLNNNNLRDLRNLTFTDMPWMLPNHEWQNLAKQTTQLWPQKQDTLMRLFAMGFDAYNLLPNLRRLKTLPQVSSSGLTGSLNVDEHGVLHRRLPWAKVSQDRVKLLAMD
jgi:outer membrane PBP1 activator LpoA protein